MNVIQNEALERFAKGCSSFAVRPQVKAWIGRALARHVCRTQALVTKCVSEAEIREAWGKKRDRAVLERLVARHRGGEIFWRFIDGTEASRDLAEEARRIIDWLDAIPDWDRHLKRIDRMSYPQAHALSEAWHERLLKLNFDADPDTVEEIEIVETAEDGVRIVELKGPAALLREGALMGHCVGGRGYVDAVRSGAARIFSVRDPQNVPHVTIEVRRNVARQIKGRGNTAPVERWAERVRSFILTRNWGVERDGNAIGLCTVGGQTFDDPNDIVHALIDAVPQAQRARLRTGRLSDLFPEDALAAFHRANKTLTDASRCAVIGALAPRPEDLVREEGENAVVGPRGLVIGRRRHRVPGVLVDALSSGLVQGEAAAQALAPAIDALLDGIEAEPHHIHSVEFTGGAGGRHGIFDQIVAFAGRGTRLAELRARVEAARLRRRDEIAAAIRAQTSVRFTGKREEGDWAHAKAHLASVSREALARMRAQRGADFL